MRFSVRTLNGYVTVRAETYSFMDSALVFRENGRVVKAFNNYNGWLTVEDDK